MFLGGEKIKIYFFCRKIKLKLVKKVKVYNGYDPKCKYFISEILVRLFLSSLHSSTHIYLESVHQELSFDI